MKYTYHKLLSFFGSGTTTQPSTHIFSSAFGYSIVLPIHWDEYEDDENVNAFFDTKNWTGNLRITVLEVDKNIDENYIEEDYKNRSNAEKITTKNDLTGFTYTEKTQDGLLYYWHLFKNNKMIVCSFILNPKIALKLHKKEIEKVGGMVNSIKIL